ncbi:flagellar hook-basal body protein [Bacteroidetes/Chlorobi group bacterium Naka2016]|jgi:flagellar basal-body rod protein FlgG|nr:MAG: flagellar hook-basal body protein [Bacteroidetes/Chlorobi group bacterium Naka2016]
MIKELYTAALGMIPQQMKLEITANNLSNANTIGFKKERLFEREIIEAKLNLLNNSGRAEPTDIPTQTYTDFSFGSFEKTNNPLDLAIENQNAFFEVEDDQGNRFLTRAGNFTLNRDGSISAKDGKFLVADTGRLNILREFTVDTSSIENTIASNIKVSERGEVYLNKALIGRIQLVHVENPESLEKVSGVYFKPTENTQQRYLGTEETVIRQGWIENSNVNPIEEMVSLIELQRLFDIGAKIIQTQDQTLDQSIRIGRFV